MDILTSRPVIISVVLAVLIVCGACFGGQWVYRDIPDNIEQLNESTAHVPIGVYQDESNNTDDISSEETDDGSISPVDNHDWETIDGDTTTISQDVNLLPINDVSDEKDLSVVNVPDHYFNPPSPPSDGIDSVFVGATEGNITERMTSYISTYYPLVNVDPELVNYNERAKAEHARQNKALDKEMFDMVHKAFSSTPIELLETLPQDLLDNLREERRNRGYPFRNSSQF